MKICVIGTGYVGLVTGSCLAEMGNDVICADIDAEKINLLKKGRVPIYEPGLEDIVARNIREERLSFTTNIADAIYKSRICIIAVGTPPNDDGSANLKYIIDAVKKIGEVIADYKVIVSKSTVPVGTAEKIRDTIEVEIRKRFPSGDTRPEFDVVSNPEFLKEGSAVTDFLKPDRIIVGTDSIKAREIMEELYAPFMRTNYRVLFMDVRSAEMTKYAANSMLASRISFMNEMANICELVGADVDMIRKGLGLDPRIGPKFLFPGIGYGGSCLPKDVKALIGTAVEHNYDPVMLRAIEEVNSRQKRRIPDMIVKRFGSDLEGLSFAVWGLAFKPDTDDIREAPSINIISGLLKMGAEVRAYDPIAVEAAKKVFGKNDRLRFFTKEYDVLKSADALLLLTEWHQFREPDFERMKGMMRQLVIFDGRNQYDPKKMREIGFEHYSIGRR